VVVVVRRLLVNPQQIILPTVATAGRVFLLLLLGHLLGVPAAAAVLDWVELPERQPTAGETELAVPQTPGTER
jgi:hypothetical protein